MSRSTIVKINRDITPEEVRNFLGVPGDFDYGFTYIEPLDKNMYISIHDTDKNTIYLDGSDWLAIKEVATQIAFNFGGGIVIPDDWLPNEKIFINREAA